MIFGTGDIHGNPYFKFSEEAFPEQNEMTKNDYVFITGDAGLAFNHKGETYSEKEALDFLESRNFTTLFCDGNHENFDRLNAHPVEEWNGGLVHKLRPSVIHLMRGQVYTINGKKFFTFGGARSHDIRDGILEIDDPKINQWWYDRTKMFRINRVTWWEQEMPSKEEMELGLENLAKHNFKVDYIITHDMPTSTLTLYCALYSSNGFYQPDELNHYLEDVRTKTEYKHWFCGHYHDDKNITQKETVLMDQIVFVTD